MSIAYIAHAVSMKLNNIVCCLKRISQTFIKNILLKFMVDKNHNPSKPLEKLLGWNELFVDCLFYLMS